MEYRSYFYTFCVLMMIHSCSLEPQIDTSEFIIEDGYKIELVASEPLLDSPVASVQDINGRLWVVEMPGYMRDIDGNDEDLRDGRVVILEDTNNDGKMDKRSIFLDGLLTPRAIALVYDGILYTDSTALVWTSITNNQAGINELVDSIYVIGGNIEHQPNGLFYNLDNWIYSAKSNARYKKKNGKWLKQATTFRGQWGISSDQNGRLVYNHNSAPIIGDKTMPNVFIKNEYQKVEHGTGIYYTKDMSINAIQPTAVNRGYEDGVLDSLGKIKNYTSACAPHLYYGTGLKDNDYSDLFVCAPEANLISKYDIDHIKQTANKRVGEEFLISKDESFRPVNIMTGYDGCLYITDMRKGIIQHTAYMSSYLREKILENGLEKISGNGRIYRISAISKEETIKTNKNKLKLITDNDWASTLNDSNYILRLLGQQKLIQKNNNAQTQIESLYKNELFSSPSSIVHNLWTLDEIGKLDAKILLDKNAPDYDMESLISITPLWAKYDKYWITGSDRQFIDIYRDQISKNKRDIDLLIVHNLAAIPHYWKDLIVLARKYPADKMLIESIISGFSNEEEFLKMIRNEKNLELLKTQLQKVIINKEQKLSKAPQLYTEPFDDNRTNGLKVFKAYCASCHGIDGKGQKNVAPSLTDSEVLAGPEKEIARIILHGYKKKSDKYQMQMPAYINDPNMSNKDVSDIINYLLSTYAKRWGGISYEEIEKIRKEK